MTEAAIAPDNSGPMFEADAEVDAQTDAAKPVGRVDKETERSELIKAVEEATKGEVVEKLVPEPKTKRTKEPAKVEAKVEPAKAETNASKLAKVLEQREKETQTLTSAQKRHEEAQGLHAQAQEILRQAQEAKKAADAELAEMKRLKANPYEAINKLGWTPEDIIDAANKKNDPNYQAQVKYEDALAKERARTATLEERLARLEGVAKTYEEQGTTQAQTQAVADLFKAIPEDSPALKMWDRDEIIAKAIAVQQQVKTKTNRVAPISEIAEYLHYKGVEKLKSLVTPAQSAGSSSAGKAKANGSRAPTPREKREAPPKPTHKLSPAEEKANLVEEVERLMAGGD